MSEPASFGTAEVWASTWVPGPAPMEGIGDASGYAVAWVQVHDGPMLQVVVDGDAPPAPGASGRLRSGAIGDETIDVFVPDAGGRA
jgi:hypothetical protein